LRGNLRQVPGCRAKRRRLRRFRTPFGNGQGAPGRSASRKIATLKAAVRSRRD
jgi:hypothetical protein